MVKYSKRYPADPRRRCEMINARGVQCPSARQVTVTSAKGPVYHLCRKHGNALVKQMRDRPDLFAEVAIDQMP